MSIQTLQDDGKSDMQPITSKTCSHHVGEMRLIPGITNMICIGFYPVEMSGKGQEFISSYYLWCSGPSLWFAVSKVPQNITNRPILLREFLFIFFSFLRIT